MIPEFLTATVKRKKGDDNLAFSVQRKFQSKVERKPSSEKQNQVPCCMLALRESVGSVPQLEVKDIPWK